MKKIFLILVMTLGVFVSRAQQISVNTDVTMLMMQIYNAGAEMTIGNRSTLGLSVLGTKNPYIKKDMKLVAIQPEYRYYFGGRPLYHHGSAIYVNGTTRPTEAGFVGMRLIPTKIGVSLSYTLW